MHTKIPAPNSAGIFLLHPKLRLAAAAGLDDHVAVRQTSLDARDAAIGVAAAPAFVAATIGVFAHDDTITAFTTLLNDNLRGSRQSADDGCSNNSAQNKYLHFQTPLFLWCRKERRADQMVRLFQKDTFARNECVFIVADVTFLGARFGQADAG
jgi:hypothetical protein